MLGAILLLVTYGLIVYSCILLVRCTKYASGECDVGIYMYLLQQNLDLLLKCTLQ